TVNYEPEPERNAQGVLQSTRNRYSTINSTNAAERLDGNAIQSTDDSQDQSSAMQNQYGDQDGTFQVPATEDAASQSTLPMQQPNTGRAACRETSNTSSGGNSVGAALAGSNNRFPVKTDVTLIAPEIDWSYAVVERQDATTLKTSLLPFNL